MNAYRLDERAWTSSMNINGSLIIIVVIIIIIVITTTILPFPRFLHLQSRPRIANFVRFPFVYSNSVHVLS